MHSLACCSLQKRDYWHWLEALPELCEQHIGPAGRASVTPAGGGSRRGNESVQVHPRYKLCLQETQNNKRLTGLLGKQRFLLRILLQKRLLLWPVETLVGALTVPVLRPSDMYMCMFVTHVLGSHAETVRSILRRPLLHSGQ